VGLLVPYTGSQTPVLIEEAQAMPGQGVRSMCTTGYGYGVWVGILGARQIPETPARPGVWKQAFRLGKDKEASRLRVIQLSPGADLRHKKAPGSAEPLLLALYGQRCVHWWERGKTEDKPVCAYG
jgi:hypothetical protein